MFEMLNARENWKEAEKWDYFSQKVIDLIEAKTTELIVDVAVLINEEVYKLRHKEEEETMEDNYSHSEFLTEETIKWLETAGEYNKDDFAFIDDCEKMPEEEESFEAWSGWDDLDEK